MANGEMVRSGFTLAEVVIAFFIFTLVSLTVMGLLLSSRAAGTMGEENAEAAQVALTEMRRLKSRPLDVLQAYRADPPAPYELQRGAQRYLVTLSVTPSDLSAGFPDDQLLTLSARLDWKQKRRLDMDPHGASAVAVVAANMTIFSRVGPEAQW